MSIIWLCPQYIKYKNLELMKTLVNRALNKLFHTCIFVLIFSTFLAAPYGVYALEIIFSSDTQVVQTDDGETFVTFFAQVLNNQECTQPVDTVLVFDRSLSMDDLGGDPPEPITGAKQAMNVFLDNMNPVKDQVGLVDYGTNARLREQLTTNYQSIRRKIDNQEPAGNTNIPDAVVTARSELQSNRTNPDAKKVMVLFSDGVSNVPNENTSPGMAIAEAEIAKQNGITVVTVGLGDPDFVDTNTLLAMASPGQFYYAPNTNEMIAIYQQLAKNLSGGINNLDVWVDVSSLLQVAEFVSASNGGYLSNQKVNWNIPEVACNDVIDLQYTFKFNGPLEETYIDDFIVNAEDENNNNYISNPVTLTALGPNLLVTKSDYLDSAENGEVLEYEVTISNIGDGYATDILVNDVLPEYLSYVGSDIPNVAIDGQNLSWVIPHLDAHSDITYTIQGTVAIPDGIYQNTLVNTITVTNNAQVVSAEDLTLVNVPLPELPQTGDPEDPGEPQYETIIDPETGEEIVVQVAEVKENVAFHPDNMRIESLCENKIIRISNVSLDGSIGSSSLEVGTNENSISADAAIIRIEYSLDGGNNYFPVTSTRGIGTKNVDIDITTLPLTDKLYGLKLRATTLRGNVFESNIKKVNHSCSGRVVILGNYYENGFGQGILSENGDLLYNNTLPLTLFAETLGGVDSLKLRLADSQEALAESPTVLEMEYDFALEIWSISLQADEFDRDVTFAQLEIGTGKNRLVKQIPHIINVDYLDTETSRGESTYKYKINFYNGLSWQKFDYENAYSTSTQTFEYQQFNLPPGTYYIETIYPDGSHYYTHEFTLNDASVVEVETKPNEQAWYAHWADPYIRHLDVSIYNNTESIGIDPVQLYPTADDDAYPLYNRLLKSETFGISQDSQILLIYWNRWNPHYSESLSIYEEVNDSMKSNDNQFRKVILITDEQSEQELERILTLRGSSLEYLVVRDDEFLNHELRYHPEVVIYNKTLKKLTRVKSTNNADELFDDLIYYSFL